MRRPLDDDPLTPAQLLESHKDCEDGKCGECNGEGQTRCTCWECGDEHGRDCEHCDGTGDCEFDAMKLKQALTGAKDEWQEFCDRYAFSPTKTGFVSNWKAMYRTEPPASAVNDFVALAQRLADCAGVNWKADA